MDNRYGYGQHGHVHMHRKGGYGWVLMVDDVYGLWIMDKNNRYRYKALAPICASQKWIWMDMDDG